MALRIEKRKQEVELYVDGRPPIRGYVFLKTGERVIDLLTQESSFFPFEAKSGEFWMIRKSSLRKLTLSAEPELSTSRTKSVQTVPVALTLTDGSEEHGRLAIEPHEDGTRLSDEINREQGFLILDCGSTVHIIGSPYVAAARELTD